MQMKVVDKDLCPMYMTTTESSEHLFFECHFSSKCIKELQHWLSINLFPLNLKMIAKKKWKGNNFRRQVIISSVYSLCYHIWLTRKQAIWLMQMNTVEKSHLLCSSDNFVQIYCFISYKISNQCVVSRAQAIAFYSLFLEGIFPIVCT